MGRKQKYKQKYYMIHLIHGLFILVLLLSGLFLFAPALRTLLGSWRMEFRLVHSVIGVGYFLFLCTALPIIIRYGKLYKRWQKTFHLALQLLLALGWTSSGLYLWINHTEYLSIRQAALFIHDVLSIAIIPWVIAHILLWYMKKNKRIVPNKKEINDRNRGIVISRRDVLLLFFGTVLFFIAGGLYRWYEPLSESFVKALEAAKSKGYFRIYSVRNDNPVFDRATWRLKVDGLVGNPSSFTMDELVNLGSKEFTSDFHCVTGWSVLDVKWKGILFKDVIEKVSPKVEGVYVKMYSADQLYTETYELKQLMENNVVLAYELNGKPLLENQGAPLRLFHPDMFGYKSIKWLNRIEVVKDRGMGYWEEKEGYDINGYLS